MMQLRAPTRGRIAASLAVLPFLQVTQAQRHRVWLYVSTLAVHG